VRRDVARQQNGFSARRQNRPRWCAWGDCVGEVAPSGSDGLLARSGWSRFWLNRLFPVVNLGASPDLNRAAAARPAMEAIWAPAGLLPINGVRWEQTGPDRGADHCAVRNRAGCHRSDPCRHRQCCRAHHDALDGRQSGENIRLAAVRRHRACRGDLRRFHHPDDGQDRESLRDGGYHPFFQAEITRARYR